MSITLTSNQIGAPVDYYKYISDNPVKTDRIGDPDLFEFTLVSTDSSFVRMNRGAYITASSNVLKDISGNSVPWFTGYIAYDPEYTYLGVDTLTHTPTFSEKYTALSDEYILSQQSLGICDPFINMTQGQILSTLANKVLPGFFDTTGIQNGLLLSRYVVDPTKNYQDIVKEFSTAAVYRFWGRAKKLFFTPQDSSLFVSKVVPVTIDGADKHFTPANLSIRATQQALINDVVVLGATEPQEYVTEYFIGDGTNALFPMMESAFGIESAVYLDDDFSGSQLDTSKWTIYDSPSNFLQVNSGYLNVLGGLQDNTLTVHLDSANLIPIAGNMSITHGDFDFISASQADGVLGVIGGLWVQTPNLALTGCVYGIQVTIKSGVTTLNEIVNGVVSMANVLTVNYNKSYVIRTNVDATRINRAVQGYNYFDQTGKVQTVTCPPLGYPDTIKFTTILSEIDLVTGLLTTGFPVNWNSSLNVASNVDPYATYVLVASRNLHATVTGTTIYTPFQASVEGNAAVDTPIKNATVTITGTVHSTSSIITGAVTFTYLGVNIGSATVLNGAAVLVVPATVAPNGSTGIAATFSPSGSTASGTVSVVVGAATGYTFASGASGWKSFLVGPNTVDGLDGLTSAATISQSGGITTSSLLGTTKYQAANPTLAFFKNTSNQTATTPQVGDLIRLKYRQAGAAVAKVRSITSVATEAQNWGDSGIRSVTRNDLSPQPTNSTECEAAAAAVLFEAARVRYEGTYTCYSNFVQGEPLAGMVLPFKNLPSNQFEVQNFAELISQVTTTLLSISPVEIYQYDISFGKATDQQQVAAVLSRIDKQSDAFAPEDSAEIPSYIDPASIGTAWSPNPQYLELNSKTNTSFTLSVPNGIPSISGVEVRSSDSGWGSDAGNNLVTRVDFTNASSSIVIPRNSRNQVAFLKFYDIRNRWGYSENLVAMNGYTGNYTFTFSGSSLSNHQGINSEGNLQNLTTYTPTNGLTSYLNIVINNYGVSGQNGVFSTSIKGAAGTVVNLSSFASSSPTALTTTTLVCTGSWVRISRPISYASGVSGSAGIQISSSAVIDICHSSLEVSTLTETVFCKTSGTTAYGYYGALSRYASAIRINYPLVPAPPTVAMFFASDLTPVVTLSLPQVAVDVWGFEIRASDGVTVLEHQDLSDAGVNPSISLLPNTNGSRTYTYYCYTYNLLGEYSAVNIVQSSLPTPALQELVVADKTKMLEWDSTNSQSFLVEIDTVDFTFSHKVVNQIVTNNFFQLSDNDFFDQRWIRVTPMDSFGSGSPETAEHQYLPDAVVELGANEIAVIAAPATVTGTPQITIPSNFSNYSSEYTTLALSVYRLNVNG